MEPQNGPSEFFATGCPFFNYKKFIFKMYYVEALRDFFGFGKKKFFQILSRECCNAKFTAVQVVECYFRVISLACEFLNKKSLYVSSRLERVLKSLAPCFQYVSDQLNIAFTSKYEKMKSFVVDSMNETIRSHDQDEEIITDLRNENEKLKKENSILTKEKEWLEQENLNKSTLNQQLRDVLSIDSSVVDFDNVVKQRKKEKEELIALRSKVPQLESSLNSTKQYSTALQEKVKTLQLDITGYKEALEDVNSIESENRELISELSNKKREYDHEINKLKRNLKNSKSYEEQDYNKLKIMMTQLEKENVQLHNRVKEMEAGEPSPTTPSGSRNFSSKVVGNVQKPQNNDIKSLFLFSLPSSNKPVKKFVKSMKLNNKSFEEYLVNVLVNNSSNFYLTFENICKTLDGFYYY